MQRQVFNCVFWGWLLILLLAKSAALASQAPVFSSQKASVRNYLNPHTGRFWSMDSYEGSSSDPASLHKYLYCHANPICGWDPSGRAETLIGFQANMAIRSALFSMALGSIFRGQQAAKQMRAGVDFGTVVYDFSIGVLTDGAIGAALPGLANYIGKGLSAGVSAIRSSQAAARAADWVWNMGAFARGWTIESQILGGARRLVPNFPVIDDLVNGVAASIKSIDLTAGSYKSVAALTSKLEGYAASLSQFTGGSARYAGQVSVVAANQIEQRVLVIAVEDGVATVEQMTAINEFVAKSKLLWPNIKVLVVPIP